VANTSTTSGARGLWRGVRHPWRTAQGAIAARGGSPFLQRALPPLVLALLVIVVSLPWRTPDPAALVLFAIVYVLYVLPRRIRRYALPATIVTLVVLYPLLIQQPNYQRFLFTVPIFNKFPTLDTMVVMAIFAMMAVGLNMVVGYAGLLDLGYVAFYALGAISRSGSSS